jgi:hypothetical protein
VVPVRRFAADDAASRRQREPRRHLRLRGGQAESRDRSNSARWPTTVARRRRICRSLARR